MTARSEHGGRWPAVPDGGRLVAVAPDLMDRGRIAAARPEVVFLAGPGVLGELGPDDVALVDLGRPGVLDAVAACPAHVVGFVAHVDGGGIDAAVAAGAAEVLARSVFFRRLVAGGPLDPPGPAGGVDGDGRAPGGR